METVPIEIVELRRHLKQSQLKLRETQQKLRKTQTELRKLHKLNKIEESPKDSTKRTFNEEEYILKLVFAEINTPIRVVPLSRKSLILQKKILRDPSKEKNIVIAWHSTSIVYLKKLRSHCYSKYKFKVDFHYDKNTKEFYVTKISQPTLNA